MHWNIYTYLAGNDWGVYPYSLFTSDHTLPFWVSVSPSRAHPCWSSSALLSICCAVVLGFCRAFLCTHYSILFFPEKRPQNKTQQKEMPVCLFSSYLLLIFCLGTLVLCLMLLLAWPEKVGKRNFFALINMIIVTSDFQYIFIPDREINI